MEVIITLVLGYLLITEVIIPFVKWLIVDVIMPIVTATVGIAYIVALVVLAVAALYALYASLRAFIKAIKSDTDPWAKYVDKNPNVVPGTKRGYFFGPGLAQMVAICKDSFANLVDEIQNINEIKKIYRSRFALWNICLGLFVLGAKLDLWVFGMLWVLMLCIVLMIVLAFGFVLFYVCFTLLWLADRALLAWKSIQNRCPRCKRLSIVPLFQCPQCGTLHKNLTPGPYGIFRVKCTCGTLLPTTVFNGRSKLKAFCPYCNENFAHGGAAQFGIQIVGPVSSGKTTFLAAFWHEYSNILKRSFGKDYTISPKKSFDELDRWYKNGLSSATTEMNASMYSIIHNFKDSKTPLQLSFYDIAGEAFNRLGDDVQQQQFQYCEGVILLIDPSTDSSKTHDSIANFIFEIKKLKGISVDALIDVPVAAVISKADLYRREIGLLRINNEAKSRPDTDKKLIPNEICRNFLQSHGFVTVLNLIDSSFTNVNFFPVSAMGHEANGSEYSSWGVLYPVLWILEQKNPAFHNMLISNRR